jgi:hypothetical protein
MATKILAAADAALARGNWHYPRTGAVKGKVRRWMKSDGSTQRRVRGSSARATAPPSTWERSRPDSWFGAKSRAADSRSWSIRSRRARWRRRSIGTRARTSTAMSSKAGWGHCSATTWSTPDPATSRSSLATSGTLLERRRYRVPDPRDHLAGDVRALLRGVPVGSGRTTGARGDLRARGRHGSCTGPVRGARTAVPAVGDVSARYPSAGRGASTQNSLPSGSARTTHGSSPVCPISALVAPRASNRSTCTS